MTHARQSMGASGGSVVSHQPGAHQAAVASTHSGSRNWPRTGDSPVTTSLQQQRQQQPSATVRQACPRALPHARVHPEAPG